MKEGMTLKEVMAEMEEGRDAATAVELRA